MNTRYCPACAARNEYTVTKPKTCSRCNCDMDKAFSNAAVVVPAMPSRPTNSLVAAFQRPLRSSLSRLPAPVIETTDEGPDIDEEDDSYDDNEMRMLAQEWSQEIDASMFFTETTGGPIKLGDLKNVREAAEKMAAGKPAKTRKPRK